MKDLFLDIEALGRKPGSAIIQLGAIVFDPATGETAAEFHRYIQPHPDRFTADLGTLAWHAEKGTWPHPADVEVVDEAQAIIDFIGWLGLLDIDEIWTWGITYDIPILVPVLEHYCGSVPWKYHAVSDARSFWKRAFPGIRHADRPHHALEDCRHGIKDLAAALAELASGGDESEPTTAQVIELLRTALSRISSMTDGESQEADANVRARIFGIADEALSYFTRHKEGWPA